VGEPLSVLFGGSLLALAVALGLMTNRSHPRRNGDAVPALRRRMVLAAGALQAPPGLYIILVPGMGIAPAESGITAELGFGLMLFAGIWFIFRGEVVRYQLWAASAIYDLQTPPDPAQVKAAETLSEWIRSLLFLSGLSIVLLRLILR
jgi:hypothetical protein